MGGFLVLRLLIGRVAAVGNGVGGKQTEILVGGVRIHNVFAPIVPVVRPGGYDMIAGTARPQSERHCAVIEMARAGIEDSTKFAG